METSAIRKRSRNACQRCQVRKKRCTADSQLPCSSCDSAGVHCILLDLDSRKKRPRRRKLSKMGSTPDSFLENASSLTCGSNSTRDDYVIPATPTGEDACGLAHEVTDTVLGETLLSSPSHISEFGAWKPVTADAVTDTANHQIASWLLLCPIPLPGRVKKDLAAYMSRQDAGSDELLPFLLRCLEFVRLRVRQICPSLCDKNRPEMDYPKCHCCCDNYGRMERRLNILYEQSRSQQSGILARCQHLLELCLNACGTAKATSANESRITPPQTGENQLTMCPEISSGMLSDRRTFCLNGSPLDIPKEWTVPTAEKDIEDRIRRWELDLMMANWSTTPFQDLGNFPCTPGLKTWTTAAELPHSTVACLCAPAIFIMRLPYAPREPHPTDGEAIQIYQRISARRLPRPLVPLDLALLHAPPVADGYNSFIGSLRTKTIVAPDILEISICRIGVLNKAVYEWNIHGPLALKAGVSVDELNDVAVLPVFTEKGEHSRQAWTRSALTRTQQAVIKYTDEMTTQVAVSDEVFKELHDVLPSNREVVELTATIAGYNCVSRFLVALNVGEHNEGKMKSAQDMAETR